jgi:hypothetical protein
MKKDRLDKFYPSFMGEERFRLHLEALYRGDEAEVKRLLESCPRESHERNEAAFAYRCKATREIVGMLCLALAPLLARLDTIESFREALPYLLKSYINEGVVAHFDGPQAALGVFGRQPARRESRRSGKHAKKGTRVTEALRWTRKWTRRCKSYEV